MSNTTRRTTSNTDPAQREGEGVKKLTVPYGGRDYELPADLDDWSILATQAMSNGRHIDAIQHLLGPQQWARLIGGGAMTKRQFEEFSELVAAELGFGTAGN